MTRRLGGTWVDGGLYWNGGEWRLATIPKEGGLLPGGGEDRYVKVPAAAMLAVAPVMGLAFAIFLPFIGFAMVIHLLARKGEEAARAASVKALRKMSARGKRRAPAKARPKVEQMKEEPPSMPKAA